MASGFWQGRRVLVTGHTGFKGGWLCVWLQTLGANVFGYALPPPGEPSLFEAARVLDGMRGVMSDVRDYDSLQQAVAEFQPEVIFHLAAQPLVSEGYQRPAETYAVNIMGTVHLLEAVRQSGSARALVNVTSDKCYENREWVWGYRENEPMGGYDPYSSSKGCAELITAAYRRSFFAGGGANGQRVGIATARAGNVIGGGDWAGGRLVPDVLRALRAREPVRLRQPQATRPWQHVLEPLSGYLVLAEHLFQDPMAYGEGWNFGPDSAGTKPVSWVVEQIGGLWDSSLPAQNWEQQGQSLYHEAHALSLDCAKAHARLGWQPKLTLSESLAWAVDWTKAMDAGADMRRVTENQIADYGKRERQ